MAGTGDGHWDGWDRKGSDLVLATGKGDFSSHLSPVLNFFEADSAFKKISEFIAGPVKPWCPAPVQAVPSSFSFARWE